MFHDLITKRKGHLPATVSEWVPLMWVHIVYLDEEIFFYNMVNDFTVLVYVLFAVIAYLLVIVSEPMVRTAIVLTRGLPSCLAHACVPS